MKDSCCKIGKPAVDHLVCTCMGVMSSEIEAAIRGGATNFDALKELLMVGSGCSSCVEEVQEIVAAFAENKLK